MDVLRFWSMKRVVLDTNILVSGFRSSRGASFAVLSLVAAKLIRPLITTALFLEYEDVLKRPEQLAAHSLTVAEVDRAIAEFAALSEPVEVHFFWRPQLADPKDELVLDAAINGRADGLITHNGRDFAAASRFGIKVLEPVELLRGMRT